MIKSGEAREARRVRREGRAGVPREDIAAGADVPVRRVPLPGPVHRRAGAAHDDRQERRAQGERLDGK